MPAPGRGVYSIRSKIDALLRRGTISKLPRYLGKIGADARWELQLAVGALDEHKAVDVVVLDLRRLSGATDYFVIASGTSDTHVRALAERVTAALAHEGQRPHHVEGVTAGHWALLDFVDFVVHIFHPNSRRYYQLERLWADAPSVSVASGT